MVKLVFVVVNVASSNKYLSNFKNFSNSTFLGGLLCWGIMVSGLLFESFVFLKQFLGKLTNCSGEQIKQVNIREIQ